MPDDPPAGGEEAGSRVAKGELVTDPCRACHF